MRTLGISIILTALMLTSAFGQVYPRPPIPVLYPPCYQSADEYRLDAEELFQQAKRQDGISEKTALASLAAAAANLAVACRQSTTPPPPSPPPLPH